MEPFSKDTALLVMDMQSAILQNLPDPQAVIGKVAEAIAKARAHQLPIFYVVVGFRAGAPEISLQNKSFAASKERFLKMNPEDWMRVHPDVAPGADGIVIQKKRISAFTGSDLEVLLRSFQIRHLVLTGVSTSGVVLSTTREAADKDYRLTILSDATADGDEEIHRVLTAKVFPRQGEVVSVGDWML